MLGSLRLLKTQPGARLALILALLGLVFARLPAPLRAADGYPIFDAHLHYSQDAWTVYSPDEILALMDQAGVYRALVSSTPDDGTRLLYERAPRRVVPILRPYRTRNDMLSWTTDSAVLDYVEERLRAGGVPYQGIGEFHLSAGQVSDPVPQALLALAADYGLVLHAHCDDVAVEALAAQRGDVRVLWAHAGMGASPARISALLDAYPNLLVELALRSDVAPGGTLDPPWLALFQRHPERVMIGTDTWITPQWTSLPDIMQRVQGWLAQLPPELATAIAYGNAERLFSR